MPRRKLRDKLYIISEILDIAKDGTFKTQIMYRANLSFTQLNDYLGFLLELHLVEKIRRNDKAIYKSTKKGLDFLERYQGVSELLSLDSPKYLYQSNIHKIKSELQELKKAIDNLEIRLLNMVKCPKCQEDIFPDYKFCPYCGKKRIREAVKSEARRS